MADLGLSISSITGLFRIENFFDLRFLLVGQFQAGGNVIACESPADEHLDDNFVQPFLLCVF